MESNSTEESILPSVEESLLPLTRRALVGGLAAMVASNALAGPAEVGSPDYRLVYTDNERRETVVLLDDNDVPQFTWQARQFGAEASFRIERQSFVVPKAVEGSNLPSVEYKPGMWRLSVINASLPGPHARLFGLTITLKRKAPAASWTIAMTSKSWWDSDTKLVFGEIQLRDFLGDNGKPLAAEPDAQRATPILKGFFGERVEAKGQLRLALTKDLIWCAEPVDKMGMFLMLQVPLAFGELRVRRIFPEDKSSWPEGNLLFDSEAPPVAGADKRLAQGLYGVVSQIPNTEAFPIIERPQGRAPTMGIDLGAAGAADTSLSIKFMFDDGVGARLPDALSAALRHWGDPEHTVAGCILPSSKGRRVGKLSVAALSGGRTRTETIFSVASLEVVRQGGIDEKVRTRFRFVPSGKEHRIETELGVFDVSALPALSPKPGLPPRIEPIEVETSDIGDRRRLVRFSARHALSHAAIALPDHIDEGGQGAQSRPLPRQTHSSRLDFDGAEVFFHIPLLDAADPGSADAVIPIGVPGLVDHWGEIILDRGRLTVMRPQDLLALKFRFADLALTLPWRGAGGAHAALAPRGGRSAARAVPHDAAHRAVPGRDSRPLLVVEFPPQHMLEQAVYRQLDEPVELPKLKPTAGKETEFDTLLAKLRAPKRWRGQPRDGSVAADRIKAREALLKACDISGEKVGDFLAAFNREATAKRLPKEQRLYAGPEFLDPDARRIALAQWRSFNTLKTAPEPRWPDVTLPPQVRDDVLAAAKVPAEERWKDDSCWGGSIREALLAEKEQRDAAFALFRKAYHREFVRLRDCTTQCAAKPAPEVEHYLGRPWAISNKHLMGEALVKFVMESTAPTPISLPLEARLSGPSRIAFRINADDYEQGRSGGRIPFSLEGLTNWSSMDMAVVRRAERLMASPRDGRLPPRWQREALTDDAAILKFQGFSQADALTQAADRSTDPKKYDERTSRVTTAERLAEVHASARTPPDPFVTALELPARLFLSPAQNATWKTPSPAIHRALSLLSSPGSAEGGRRCEPTWTARLMDQGTNGGVRAVWSPDFRPSAFLRRTGFPKSDVTAPPRGGWKPWAIRRELSIRSPADDLLELERHPFLTGLDAYDRHELVALSGLHGLPVSGRRQKGGSLDREGSQIEPPPGFYLADIERSTLDGSPPTDQSPARDYSAIYQPTILKVIELMISARGASFNFDTTFVPPASARTAGGNLYDALSIKQWRHRSVITRDVRVEVLYKGFLFPLGHDASLVKITERLFIDLGSTGAIALLVQRKFLQVGDASKKYAAEGQPNGSRRWTDKTVQLLTRETPDLVDPDADPGSTACPATSQTSDLPTPSRSGRLVFPGGAPGICFWPRIAARDGADVWFKACVEGESLPFRLPLLFVDNRAINDPRTMERVTDYYNLLPAEEDVSPTRFVDRGGQSVSMAPEKKPGDTTYETQWWNLKAEGRESGSAPSGDIANVQNRNFARTPLMVGKDQPPFYPFIEKAFCRLSQAERFSGSAPIWKTVAYDPYYVREGFPGDEGVIGSGAIKNKPEAFLVVLDNPHDMDFKGRGDLAGGVCHPVMNIVGCSRAYGVLSSAPGNQGAAGGAHAPAATQAPSPKSYFQRGGGSPFDGADPLAKILPTNAKLLGIAPLSKILGIDDIAKEHPALREVVTYGSRGLEQGSREARAILRDTIIKPLADLVGATKRQWAEVARQQLGSGATSASLGQALPQIRTALDELDWNLQQCLLPGQSEAAFIAGLSEVHASGQRLIRALEAIAQDPLGSISDQQLAVFRDLKTRFDTVLAEAMKTATAWATLPSKLLDALVGRMIDQTATSVRRFLVTLPVPAVDAVLRDKVERVVDTALRDALREALCKPGAGTCSVDVGALGNGLGRLPELLRRNLEAAGRAAAGESDVQRALDQLLHRIADETLSNATNAFYKALGEKTPDEIARALALEFESRLLTPAATPLLKALNVDRPSRLPARLAAIMASLSTGNLADNPAEFLNQLAEFIPPLAALLAQLEQSAMIGRGAAACAQLRDVLTKMADLFLPQAKDIEALALCIVRVKDHSGTAACPIAPNVTFSVAAIKALEALREVEILLSEDGRKPVNVARVALQDVAGSLADVLTDLAQVREELTLAFAGSGASCSMSTSDLVTTVQRLARSQQVLVLGVAAFGKQCRDAIAALKEKVLDPASIAAATKAKAIAAAAALLDLLAGELRSVVTVTLLKSTAPAVTGLAGDLRGVADKLVASLAPVKEELEGAAAALEAASTAIVTGRQQVEALAQNLERAAEDARTAATVAEATAVVTAAVTQAGEVANQLRTLRDTLLEGVERKTIDLVLRLAAQSEAQVQNVLDALTADLVQPARQLKALYGEITKKRLEIETTVEKEREKNKILADLIDGVQRQLGVPNLFRIEPIEGGKDDIDRESDLAAQVADQFAAGDSASAFAALREFGTAIQQVPAPLRLVERIGQIDASSLRFVVVRALDLAAFRNEIESRIRQLIPTRARLSYDLSGKLKGFGKFINPIPGTKLSISTVAEVDLLSPKAANVSVTGSVGPFDLHLLPSFEAVILGFRGLSFSGGSGRSPDFKVQFGDTRIGKDAEFLKQLQTYLSPRGGGLKIASLKEEPGIEASYGINLGSFGVGTLSFSNVVLFAGAELPFQNTPARFRISIGRPEAPFLISSTVFGGGGYLSFVTSTEQGFRSFECSFDYGGVFAFGFGPLSGSGQVTIGIYVRMSPTSSSLGGTFIARGSASIACFGFSTSLFVQMVSENGHVSGSATYTFSFSLGFHDVEFSVGVTSNQGTSMGTQGTGNGSGATGIYVPGTTFAIEEPGEHEPRVRLAANGPFVPETSQGQKSRERAAAAEPAPLQSASAATQPLTGQPRLRVSSPSQRQDWAAYRKYFESAAIPQQPI